MRVAKQSTARNVNVLLIASSDHITGLAGATLTITASKDGGAFASTSPTVTDLGSGWYKLALTTTDTNTLGDLALHITATSADPQDILLQVVAYDPIDAVALGLSRLDAAVSSRMATYTQPTGFLAATFPSGTVANTTNITAGTITTVTNVTNDVGITQAAADKAWSTTTRVLTAGTNIALAKGTGVTGFNDITAAAAATGVWQDTTAGDFTVASSIGKSLFTSGNAPGAASGLALVGSNMGSAASVTAGVTVTTNNDKTGYGLSAAAVQAIWDALTSALTTVGSIGKLLVTNIDALISSRSTYAGADTAGTTTLLSRLTGTRATNLDNLDATVSSRSTYAGGAVASVTGAVGSVAAGGITTASFAVGAIDSTVLASSAEQAIADKTLATPVDGVITLKQITQIIAAATTAKLSGAATTTVTIRNVSDSVNAIVATVDANGNRSATTYVYT